jgi:lipopolysaccharide export system protein LptA
MKLFLAVCMFLLWVIPTKAQETNSPDTARRIDIINANKLGYKKIDSTNEIQTAVGNAIFKNGNTLFYADSVVYNKALNQVEAFGNVHINDADSVHTYARYLIYYVNDKKAILRNNVRLTDGKGVLTTQELEYFTQQKIGTYRNGGKVVNGSTSLTSREATYYADMKDVYFKREVKLRDPKYSVDADSLLYNTQSAIATFISETTITDSSKRKVVTSEGFYDTKNKLARFSGNGGKRPLIKDGATTITGDEVSFDDQAGESYAKGNAVYTDSTQGISVIANSLVANKAKGTFLATQKPLMILKQKQDSLYLSADTLFSGRFSDLTGKKDTLLIRDTVQKAITIQQQDTANRDRYFIAHKRVRIFSDSLQAVCDSLFYGGIDSVFRLFQNPIVWANKTQVTGDTIYLFTKNRNPENLQVFENALTINRTHEGYYNQLKGNRIQAYFKEGQVDYIRARGSAESIFYMQDQDSAYVGVNKATADIIDIIYKNKELNKVVFRSDARATAYPFQQADHNEMRLRGFKWLEERRPKTAFALFEDPIE